MVPDWIRCSSEHLVYWCADRSDHGECIASYVESKYQASRFLDFMLKPKVPKPENRGVATCKDNSKGILIDGKCLEMQTLCGNNVEVINRIS